MSESQFRHSLSREGDILSRKDCANTSNPGTPSSPGSHGNASRETIFDVGSNTLPRGKRTCSDYSTIVLQILPYESNRIVLRNESFVSNEGEPSAFHVPLARRRVSMEATIVERIVEWIAGSQTVHAARDSSQCQNFLVTSGVDRANDRCQIFVTLCLMEARKRCNVDHRFVRNELPSSQCPI